MAARWFPRPCSRAVRRIGAAATVLALAACGSSAPGPEPRAARLPGAAPRQLSAVDAGVIRAAVEDPARLAEDRERDASSKPAEILTFVGIAPGMTVLDFAAGGGYYTELLARIVGPHGKVIAHNHPGARAMLGNETFERRYGSDRLPNAEQLFARHEELRLAPQSLDAVLMSMVYHDVYWSDPGVDWGPIDAHAMLARLYAALEPGGVVGVIDHSARPGSDPHESAKALHRIDPAVVRRDFLAAGFELEAESEVLRSPEDDLTRSVFDPAIYRRTDRFVFRFRRPAEALDAGADSRPDARRRNRY